MNKKGVELTLTTIVVAALLLIVLAVVVFIFFGESNDFREGINTCSAGTVCQEASKCSGKITLGTCKSDTVPNGVCCAASEGTNETPQ